MHSGCWTITEMVRNLIQYGGFSPVSFTCYMEPVFFVPIETYMRRVVQPLEALLTTHKRIVLKDSAVSGGECISLCQNLLNASTCRLCIHCLAQILSSLITECASLYVLPLYQMWTSVLPVSEVCCHYFFVLHFR